MNNTYTTGSPIVDQMAKVRITGNIINPYWYKNILYENGKPNLNAINILADIVYWHRPTEVRDEETGEQIGLKKKFKGKSFHRSYRQFQNQFGLSKRQIQLALQALEDIGVIKRHYHTVEVNGQVNHNAMFIDLVPIVLLKLSDEPQKEMRETIQPSDIDVTTQSHERDHGMTCIMQDSDRNVMTNTNNKESNGDYKSIKSYQCVKEDFKEQIGYDAIVIHYPLEVEILDGIVELVTEVMMSTKKTMRINQEDLPVALVQTHFRKLNMSDVEYVIECLVNSKTKARNIKAFMLTCLYNAKTYRNMYVANWVSSNMYQENNDLVDVANAESEGEKISEGLSADYCEVLRAMGLL